MLTDTTHPLTGDVGLAASYMAPMPAVPTIHNTAYWHPSEGYLSKPKLPSWSSKARDPGEELCMWIHLSPELRQRIISNYCSVQDLFALDQAVGSVARRKELAAVCTGMHCHAIDNYKYKSVEGLRWVMSRSIDIRNFTFTLPNLHGDMTAFHHLCAESVIDVVTLLIIRAKRMDVNAVANYAAYNKASKDKNVAKTTDKNGKSKKDESKFMMTPLLYAFFSENTKILRLLVLVARAKTDVPDPFGNTLLHYASEAGNIELVRLFVVQAHANASIKGSRGNTALHWAVRMGHVEIIRILISDGKAQVDVQNDAGYTPLHVAVKEVHIAVAHILVAEFNASVILKDKKGRIPLELAAKKNLQADLIQLLEEATVRVTRTAVTKRLKDINAHAMPGEI
jgi:ankyrin repeat protein